MARFDTHLFRPTLNRVVEALVDATSAANREVDLLHREREHWEEFVAALRDLPEGRRQWADTAWGDTALVSIAWWTDYLGQRHFRICAGNSRDGSYQDFNVQRRDRRPPLWHLFPDGLFQRRRQKEGVWLAACACGACGAPEALGWMGPCCGPCHDRREEQGGAGPPRRSTWRAEGAVCALAFSPDGGTLAAARADNSAVGLWDVRTGALRGTVSGSRRPANTLAFSPDGALLACADASRQLLVTDLSRPEVVLRHQEAFEVAHLAFAPHGLTLATGGCNGLHVWERPGRAAPWRMVQARDGEVTALAFNPSGDRLAVGGPGKLALLDARSGEQLPCSPAELPQPLAVRVLGFAPDGASLVAVGLGPNAPWTQLMVESLAAGGLGPNVPLAQLAGEWDPDGRVQVWDVLPGEARRRSTHTLERARHAALSADARWLAWLPLPGHNSEALVTFHEISGNRCAGSLGWDLAEGLTCLALAPDGQTLASGGRAGTIKLWPWRLLLEA
jgi:WD40 repeat protein